MRKPAAYGLAIATVFVATILTLSVTPVRLKSPFLLYTVAVMATAAWGGFGAGIFAVLLAIFAAFYFLIEPIYTFRLGDPAYTIPLVLFGIVGSVITWGVTLLTRARQQAEESRERFHSAFVDAHIGFALADASGGMIEVNRAFCQTTGYAECELLGKPLRAISHPDDIEVSARLFDQVATRKLPSAVYEKRYLRKDGSPVWVRVSAAAVLGPGGKVPNQVITLVEDITQAKRLEQELRQAQKMEAIGRLAGGVAHDFNNLLTVIGGYSRLLLTDQKAVAGALQEPLLQIAEAADRAAALTGQLLAFSRRRGAEPREIELNGVVANLERMLKRLLGEDVSILLSLDPASGQIRADPGQIEQVIMNLAVNARDAMPCGGRLVIETGSVAVDEVWASGHIGLAAGEYVLLTVSDNGCGMTPEVQAHLFEPFYTTKAPGKGTGLGLSIVYGIVQQQGGKVLVYSEPGKGTSFKLFFPKLQMAGEPQHAAPARQGPRTGKETILVVEDNQSVREYVRAALGQLGYTLLEAEDGAQALDLVRKYPGEISLLLTDVVMPQMSGPEVVRGLRELRSGLKVLYMSGYTELSLEVDLGRGEAMIQKPFSPSAIAERVREVLDHEAHSKV
jgi:PAS domain S-box-containing protein